MRTVPAAISDALREGTFTGERRAMARVTVQHPTMKLRNYTMLSTFTENVTYDAKNKKSPLDISIDVTKGQKVHQTYADFMFSQVGKPREMPNVKSVTWSRSIATDVAECTIEAWNTKPLPLGTTPRPGELDLPGYYTYSRGGSAFSSRWSHVKNEWFGMLVPDNIIRTYEGYGFDASVPAEHDPHLVQTGTWMIDSVTMNANGTLSIKCRDMGRLLLDQHYVEPVIPKIFYNRGYENWSGTFELQPKSTKLRVKATDSSNRPWIGSGSVHGHKLSYAFDGDPNTYWLSIGNIAPSRRFAYEWVECSVGNQTVTQVKVRAKKKGYTCYVSVKVGGVWQGSQKVIDYHEDGIGMNGGDIPYVATAPIDSEKLITIKLPKALKKVQAVRVTFGNLQNFHVPTYNYRAGIADVQVHNTDAGDTKTAAKKGPAGSNPGRYDDFTDLIKLFCAWAGFLWPKGGYRRLGDATGTHEDYEPTKYDWKVLGHGVKARVYGDFQQTLTNGAVPLGADKFDKKSLMECIGVIKETVGFLFYIDELGGAQWRFPNIQNRGYWRSSISGGPATYVYNACHPIDENTILMTLDCTISSANVREMNFITDGNGKHGAFSPGFDPNPTGMRRVGVWTDAALADGTDTKGKDADKVAQLLGDLISLAALFTYRTDRVRIPANPSIQIDDQVRIMERTTAEGYLHYVKGISSSNEIGSGVWTYDLDTHWLGFDPKSRWLFNPTQFDGVTQDYLGGIKISPIESFDRSAQVPYAGTMGGTDPGGTGDNPDNDGAFHG